MARRNKWKREREREREREKKERDPPRGDRTGDFYAGTLNCISKRDNEKFYFRSFYAPLHANS